jgi:hypothetical protein
MTTGASASRSYRPVQYFMIRNILLADNPAYTGLGDGSHRSSSEQGPWKSRPPRCTLLFAPVVEWAEGNNPHAPSLTSTTTVASTASPGFTARDSRRIPV